MTLSSGSVDESANKKKNKSKMKSSLKSQSKQPQSQCKYQQSKPSKSSKDKTRESLVGSKKSLDSDKLVSVSASIVNKIHKIESMNGPIMIRNEAAMNTAGYFLDHHGLMNQTEYSQILRATRKPSISKNKKSKTSTDDNEQQQQQQQQQAIVCKMVNLTELSPKFRQNLLQNSVRILRYLSQQKQLMKSPSIFIKVYEVFQMEAVRLYIFMDECQQQPSLYDLIRSSTPLKIEDVRRYTRSIALGINQLQKIGVAHRNVKLQHMLFTSDQSQQQNLKLCGWNRATFSYQIDDRKKVNLQSVERRVRRNYFLPPETFQKQYDPSKIDCWSIGIALCAMVTKRYPFNVRDERTKFRQQWIEFMRKHEMNIHIRNLCSKIFQIEPRKRPTCEQILADRFFDIPLDRLIPLSIKAGDECIEHESSRIGALSAIDNDAVATTTPATTANDQNVAEENVENTDQQQQQQETQQIEDGGAVGDEENMTAEEKKTESQMETEDANTNNTDDNSNGEDANNNNNNSPETNEDEKK